LDALRKGVVTLKMLVKPNKRMLTDPAKAGLLMRDANFQNEELP